MNESGFRFSLRSFFLVLTLAAVVVASLANYPAVFFISLIFVVPLLFVAAMALLNNGPPDRSHSPAIQKTPPDVDRGTQLDDQ